MLLAVPAPEDSPPGKAPEPSAVTVWPTAWRTDGTAMAVPAKNMTPAMARAGLSHVLPSRRAAALVTLPRAGAASAAVAARA